jgi:hypothetical protein
MGIGVQPVITDGDLALVGDVRCHPGNEFLAADVEARMLPAQKPLCPLRAEELAVVLEIIKRYDASKELIRKYHPLQHQEVLISMDSYQG